MAEHSKVQHVNGKAKRGYAGQGLTSQRQGVVMQRYGNAERMLALRRHGNDTHRASPQGA